MEVIIILRYRDFGMMFYFTFVSWHTVDITSIVTHKWVPEVSWSSFMHEPKKYWDFLHVADICIRIYICLICEIKRNYYCYCHYPGYLHDCGLLQLIIIIIFYLQEKNHPFKIGSTWQFQLGYQLCLLKIKYLTLPLNGGGAYVTTILFLCISVYVTYWLIIDTRGPVSIWRCQLILPCRYGQLHVEGKTAGRTFFL